MEKTIFPKTAQHSFNKFKKGSNQWGAETLLRDIAINYQTLRSTVGYTSLIKSYLLPHLKNERDIELIANWKANQFAPFKIGKVDSLDILNVLGETANLDAFVKAFKTSDTKRFFLKELFGRPDKLNYKNSLS